MKKCTSIIGKVHIKDLAALKEYHDSGNAKAFHDNNWSVEKPNSIGFYGLQKDIPGLSKALDNMVDNWRFDTLYDLAAYYATIDQTLNLLYLDPQNRFAVICGPDPDLTWLIPYKYLSIEMFKDYSEMPLTEMRAIGENSNPLSPASMDDTSASEICFGIEEKREEIRKNKEKIEALEAQKKAELEEYRLQLEAKYKEKSDMLQAMKDNLDAQVEALNKQLYMIESEIYAIRCITGEVVHFTRLTEGQSADMNVPVVINQKLRFLDEELGKWLAIYEFEGSNEEIGMFENVLKNRAELRDLFCPGEKAVSFVKISRTGIGYTSSDTFANLLDTYKKYHGATIAILVKDGENLYIGWTDQGKIALSEDNVFFAPQKESISQETDHATSSTQEEMLSRVFIFSVLQGLINDNKLIHLPEKVSVTKPNPYVVFSLADAWIEDNTYGSWEDILNSSGNENLRKGDMVLTTQRITRDDAGFYGGRSTVGDAYNNDRGRGEKNRTHDVSISDCTVYPINLVDKDECYNLYYLDYPYAAIEHKYNERPHKNGGITYEIRYEYIELQGPPVLTKDADVFENGIHSIYGKITEENIQDFAKWEESYYHEDSIHCEISHKKCFRREFYRADHIATEEHYFISEEKADSGYDWRLDRTVKKAHANMEVYKGEFLDLTYLDSVRLKYAIVNRKVNNWCIGHRQVDYAMALKYLNKALEYLIVREKTEKDLLLKYADQLPENWPVLLSSWRHEKGYHSLTETRAKAFVKTI